MNVTISMAGTQFNVDLGLLLLWRDNLQHHVQAGRPGPGFPIIHALADSSVSCRSVSVASTLLWAESVRALSAVGGIEVKDLAISLATCAFVTGIGELPGTRGTMLLRLHGQRIPLALGGARTLGDLLATYNQKLEALTYAGRRRGLVEIAAVHVRGRELAVLR